MYCSHFGLHRPPFNNTPDPSFYFGTAEHEEALATLEYATVERKGFVLLTGEVGAGKTLIGRMFLRRIESRARTAVITHTQLSGRQLLAALCSEFELQVPADASNLQLAERLQAFLLEQYAQNRLVVVLLDEAQNLPDESFEAVRMLGNLESDDAKLIQFCVLGQPELRTRFEQPGMRQLNQRLFRRFHLEALTETQATEYIRHRLRMAGWSGGELFTEAAIKRIFIESRGTPRLINRMCDNALLTAYGRGARTVEVDIIEEVAASQLESAPAAARNRPRPWLDADPAESSVHRGERASEPQRSVAPAALEWGGAATAAPSSTGRESRGPAGDELRGTVRPWLDAGRSLADYRNRVQAAVDDVTGRCDDMQERIEELKSRVGESDRDIRSLVQTAAEGLAGLNAQVKELESRCSSAAEIDRVRAECGAGMTEMLRRIGEQAGGLEKLKQDFAAAMEKADRAELAGLEEGSRRLEAQVAALQRLGEEMAKRESGLDGRIDLLTGQIARSGGKVDELRNQIMAHKNEFESLVGGIAGRLEGLGRELAGLHQYAATRQDLEEARCEHAAAVHQLRGEHELAISDIQSNLARHESAVQELGRHVRVQVSAIDEAVSSLRESSASRRDIEILRAQQAEALAGVDRQLAEETDVLAGLRQELDERINALGEDAEGTRGELKRRMTAHGRRLRDLRLRLSRMRAAIEGRLDGLERELSGLRENSATRQELAGVRSEQLAALSRLEGDHARAVAGIQDDLVQHENVVLDLGRQVRARMTAIEEAVSSLRDTSASAQEFEDLRTEQSAALAEMARRIREESEALARLQEAVSHAVAAAPAEQEAVRAELSRQMLAQARRVRDLRQRLARMRAAIEGRLDGLGRELAALRAEMATRQDLERAQAEQSATLDGLKDEHARAVADIHTDLAHHEHAFQDLNRRIRDRMAVVENGVNALKSTSASRQEVEELRARQAEALSGVDRRLAEEAEALAVLQQALGEQKGTLAGDQQGTKEELLRRMLVHARRVREMRSRLSRLQAATVGRLEEWKQELTGLREEMATRHDLEVIQAQNSAALEDLKGEHARAVADLRGNLAEREGAVEDLSHQVDERMATLERGLDTLRAAALSELDLERMRSEQAEALAGIDERLARESEALVGLREVLEARMGTAADGQETAREDVLRRMLAQARRVRQLRNRLGQARVAIEGRLEGLTHELAAIREQMTSREEFEDARAELVAALRAEMATHQDLEAVQSRQSAALEEVKTEHARSFAGIQTGLVQQKGVVTELGRRVREGLGALAQADAEQAAALEGIKSEHTRAVAEIQNDLSRHESIVADLNRQVQERMTVLEAGLEQAQQSSAMSRDVENLRSEQTVIAAEIARRLTLEAEAIAELKRELEARSGTLSRDQQAAKEELEGRLLTQARRVRDLRQRVANIQAAIETRLDALTGNVRDGERLLAEMSGRLGEHEREIRVLDERMEERLAEARRAVEACQEQSAARAELETLRANQAGVIDEMERRLAADAEQLREFQQAVEQQSASALQEQQAGLAALAERIGLQAGRARRLHRRLRQGQQSLDTRLEEMSQRFAARADLDALRSETQGESAQLRERLKLQRQATEGLISGVVQRCRAVQDQIDALATAKAEMGDVTALSERQEQATAELLERLEREKEGVGARFEEVFAQWQRTDGELARLAASAAPAEELAVLRERQEQDTRQTLAALAAQRGELERLLVDVRRRCDEFSTRLAMMPDEFDAVRREHAEQMRTVCERMDSGRSHMDTAVREVTERCRQAQEQIELLAARAASTDDVAAVRETHARDFGAVLNRLDRTDSDHQQELSELNRRWDQLAQGVCSVAATAAPATSFAALEEALNENLSEVRAHIEAAHVRHKEDLRSMVWTVQQLEARLAAVEAADRPAPVKIELNPEAGRDLAAMTETARREREELARLAERADAARLELTGAAGRLDGSLAQWRAGATGVDEKAGELRASVCAAGELLKTMQRAQQVLDSKLNSHRWQQELARGEALAGRLERSVGEATAVCGQLQAALRDFDGCRDEADAWAVRFTEVRELADGLTKLLKAGRKAGASLESELDHRKRMLAAITQHAAGLADVIDSARRTEPSAARRFRPETTDDEGPASRLDWPDVLHTAERLATTATAR